MTISRGQMNRQLYEGGGIMSLSKEGIGGGSIKGVDMGSRIGFFSPFKAAKKAVKKVTKGVKDLVSSDAGKTALLAAATFKLGGGSFGDLLKKGPLQSGFSLGNIPIVGSMFQGGGKDIPFLQDKGNVALGILGLSTLAGLSAADREEIEEADPTERGKIVKEKLRQSLSRLGYSGQELETKVAEGVSEYFAGAGGYAYGGRIKKALGDTASDNAMQAAGIEGLPIRQNPKGVKELDLRDSGGFIPPVGIKEKEDDIPAMLSNNEFVFTADAVRGMGDGDVDLGAQRMYDMMKKLEEGGRV
jgi:hypothetical protein